MICHGLSGLLFVERKNQRGAIFYLCIKYILLYDCIIKYESCLYNMIILFIRQWNGVKYMDKRHNYKN